MSGTNPAHLFLSCKRSKAKGTSSLEESMRGGAKRGAHPQCSAVSYEVLTQPGSVQRGRSCQPVLEELLIPSPGPQCEEGEPHPLETCAKCSFFTPNPEPSGWSGDWTNALPASRSAQVPWLPTWWPRATLPRPLLLPHRHRTKTCRFLWGCRGGWWKLTFFIIHQQKAQ